MSDTCCKYAEYYQGLCLKCGTEVNTDCTPLDNFTEVCSVCSGPFDIESEGGIAGWIGIIPCAFCPTCYAGITDMVSSCCNPGECTVCEDV